MLHISGKTFCLGHGDGLGPGHHWYKLMRWGFRAKFFSPCSACSIRIWLSASAKAGPRKAAWRSLMTMFSKAKTSLYTNSRLTSRPKTHVDYFVFGHYHCDVRMPVSGGGELVILKDWMNGSSYMYFDGISMRFGYSPKMEK